jgi:hypothetical protein
MHDQKNIKLRLYAFVGFFTVSDRLNAWSWTILKKRSVVQYIMTSQNTLYRIHTVCSFAHFISAPVQPVLWTDTML